MKSRIRVPEDMREALEAFVREEGIPLEVVSTGECAVRILRSDEPMKCEVSTLHAGGWIACRTASAVALKLGVEPGKIGRLLDHLRIKIRECEFGLF